MILRLAATRDPMPTRFEIKGYIGQRVALTIDGVTRHGVVVEALWEGSHVAIDVEIDEDQQ